MLKLLRLPQSPAPITALPRILNLFLLLAGLAIVIGVPLAGAPPPPPPLLGQPGVIKTFDPRLQQLERDIAAGHPKSFQITFTQADLDAEIAAQFRRLEGKLPVSGAYIQPGSGLLSAGGVLNLGPASLPARIELSVTAADCQPVVQIQTITVGSAETPGWLRARAEALVHSGVDEALRRGLGFCLEEVITAPGAITVAGRVEERQP